MGIKILLTHGILAILFHKVDMANIYSCSDADTDCSIMDIQCSISIRKSQEVILVYYLHIKIGNVGKLFTAEVKKMAA